jgi:hypothetical protein
MGNEVPWNIIAKFGVMLGSGTLHRIFCDRHPTVIFVSLVNTAATHVTLVGISAKDRPLIST